VDRQASRPLAAVAVVTAATVWIAISIAAGFPARWETIFQTLVAALTLTMVFVIQHTQARHQRATQRKLDEILLAMPGTDNSLLRLEHASDDELRAAADQHREIRQNRLDGYSGAGGSRVLCAHVPILRMLFFFFLRILRMSRGSTYGSSPSGTSPPAAARPRSSSALNSAPNKIAMLEIHSQTRKMITPAMLP
jgi:low affinity Fe/Cu permease